MPDGFVERLKLARVEVGVGHDEDLRLDGLLPAGAVRAPRVAAGQQGHDEEGYESCASHAATVRIALSRDHGALPPSHIRILGSTLRRGRECPVGAAGGPAVAAAA